MLQAGYGCQTSSAWPAAWTPGRCLEMPPCVSPGTRYRPLDFLIPSLMSDLGYFSNASFGLPAGATLWDIRYQT